MTEAAYRQIVEDIKKNKGKIENLDWQMTRVKILGQTLASEPLKIKDGMIAMTLPYYEKQKCSK